jgi:hypothetical protein
MDLCAKCTAHVLTRLYCCHCDGPATPITVPRNERPFGRLVLDALAWPLRGGLLALVGMALVLAVVARAAAPSEPGTRELGALIAAPLRVLLLLLFCVRLVGATARGGHEERGAALRLLHAVLGTAIVWAPAVVYLVYVQRGFPDGAMLRDRLVWLLLGLAALYLPAAIAGTAGEASFLDAINPFRVFEWAWAVRRRYGLTVLILAALTAGMVGLGGVLSARIEQRLSPFLAALAVQALAVAVLIVMARLVGTLTYVHGDSFGWGTAEQYRDSILPGVVADGVRKKSEQPTPAAVAEKPAAAPAPQAPRNPAEAARAKEIADCIRGDNLARALRLYEAQPAWSASAFEDQHLLAIGTTAAQAKKLELAERLLAALGEKRGLYGGRALVALGRLYAEAMGRPERAKEIYARVVEQHPGTEMARFAQQKLAAG